MLAAVQAAATAHPQIQIAETGDASINKAVNDTIFRDLRRVEMLSFPITLVVLLIAFGAVVAALLPLALAAMAIPAATGLVAFTSHLSGETTQASSVMLCIGLAVGVDYSMFYVKRQREERAAGRPVLDAIEIAAATSGRSVLISGLTVLVAMSGMFLTGNKVFYGMAQASVLVVAVAVAGSLTLLPALLALLGDRVDRGQLPQVSLLRRPLGRSPAPARPRRADRFPFLCGGSAASFSFSAATASSRAFVRCSWSRMRSGWPAAQARATGGRPRDGHRRRRPGGPVAGYGECLRGDRPRRHAAWTGRIPAVPAVAGVGCRLPGTSSPPWPAR